MGVIDRRLETGQRDADMQVHAELIWQSGAQDFMSTVLGSKVLNLEKVGGTIPRSRRWDHSDPGGLLTVVM